ncbi:hypothetical protein GCM10010495_75800 [Kitasatospora herbaricolor]|nr:hypothetical protein [Kitasatospora herbaricolor]GGV47017.1 hypothetical protein GCM10010495_75800 [Kitasatospora herbaricolor]
MDGAESVRFTYAGQQFEVWLGATKYGLRWLFATAGHRESAIDYGYGEKDPVDHVARAAMRELKAGMHSGPTTDTGDHPPPG